MSVFSSVRVVFRQPCRSFRAYKTQTVATAERTVEDEVRTSVKGREEPLSGEEWSELRNRLLKYRRVCTPVNVDATILGLCQRHGSVEMGQSYVRFLEEKEIPLTAAIAGKYLKLFALDKGEATLSPAESSEVLRVCGIIRENHPVLDSTTAENLIYALCLTSEWKESVELLEQVKVFGQPSHAAFNDIAQAAFRNCCPEKGVSILEEGICGGRLPYAASLIAWIDSGDLEGMLTFLQRHNLQIPESVATALKKHLEQSRKIPVTMSSVSRNKVCGSCRTRLDEVTVEKDEFRKLRDAFHEKVLIKDNIFIKSTPQEFNEFQQFLDRTGPFDVVIDGLNVAYSVGANRPVNHLAGHILAAMKHFTEEDKRVLILGREHMKRWPSFIKRIQTNNGEVFLTENLTQDDPFFIYAALHSGPHCDIFTRDLLRTHAHQLGPELGAIFRKWQRIHQFSYKSPTSSATPRIFVQPPIKYKIEAHRNSSGHWHVPWSEGGAEYAVGRLPEVPFEVPIRWLCFRSNRSQL